MIDVDLKFDIEDEVWCFDCTMPSVVKGIITEISMHKFSKDKEWVCIFSVKFPKGNEYRTARFRAYQVFATKQEARLAKAALEDVE